jgi:molybdopterin-guanine dinucleotide biosynthesis protein MobB
LPELLALLSPCDLVLVEGFKAGTHPKLEVYRASCGQPPLSADDASVEAIATDDPTSAGDGFPRLPLDDTDAVLDFVLARVGLDRSA